jgi:hypothetical protein
MSQQTNLNVSPYFDDFDATNDYYKVLFKPGYPVQARELTTLQSILQNQIEKFGQHFFKEGAKVIPGNTGYNAIYYAVELNNTYLGIPIEAYISQLVGTKITGQTSGVTAVVEKVLSANDSERGNVTLYVNYISSNTQNNSTQQFSDDELLETSVTIISGLLGNTSIPSGSVFASTIANNSTSVGSAFSITNGVYFIRGQFVNVNTETLILDQYTNKPNYRVGLFINEEIINADIDQNLTDNSQGFNNYAAPGADRLKITVSLYKKNLADFNDNNFIELATINNGIIKSQSVSSNYNLVKDELAKKTYAESGNYYINPYNISVVESLNDGVGNRGIFNSGQFTYGGSTSSDDLAIYQISPGKSVVRGYEVENTSPIFLDVPKPRTTKTINNQSINYNTGSTLKLNRVYGTPTIGIGNTYVLSLRDERVGYSSTIAPGNEIGVARVYDFRLESGKYNTSNKNINEWDISLYDIQTISEITLNQPIDLSIPTFIKGKSSGATAFLRYAVSAGTAVTVYEKSGEFIANESFIFNGIENNRVAIAVTSYGIFDIKSVYGIVGSASTFTADVIQSDLFNIGIATISALSGGISTVYSPNPQFPGKNIRAKNIIKYSGGSSKDPVFAKVVSVGETTITISGITTITGIVEGKLPSSTLNVTDLKIISSSLSSSSDNTLYTKLPKDNIESIDLTDSYVTIRKIQNVNISGNQLSSAVTAGTNETFLPFSDERYSLIRSDGTTEILTSNNVNITSDSLQLQINNLGSNDTNATLITTLKKSKIKSKLKIKNRVNTLIIDKSKYSSSGTGSGTLNDGLIYGNYPYGTRIQDEIISLNVPDIIEIYSIYESSDITAASAPKVVLSSLNGPSSKTSDLIIGEKFTGQSSGAVAICAEKLTDYQISFVSKNQYNFKEGETVIFEESKVRATITTLTSTSFDVSFNYSYDNGQNGSFYNYGTINRKSNALEPSKKLKIYFSNGYYQSSDSGDITTVQSYDTFNYGKEIQSVDNIRNTDLIDIRPRVSNYSVSIGSRSPLEFYGRTFNSSGNSAANILASDESIVTTFSFYLGRIDRVYLTKDGKFQIKYGTPSEKPETPVSVDDAMEISSVMLPPYLYNVSQSSLRFLEHKKYRMVDIKQLENRIKNLEYYTSLSLLETNTANLFVSDENGLNRFKSGFFVDNFSSLFPQENGVEYKNSIDISNKELRPKHYTNSVDLIVGPVTNVDPSEDLEFSVIDGINTRKTGDIITLDYAEIEWLKQSFATRSENVTPFIISFWQGSIEITPASDSWMDTVRINAKSSNTEGNYSEILSLASRTIDMDSQIGFAPVLWDSWETIWVGKDIIETPKYSSMISGSEWGRSVYDTQVSTIVRNQVKEIVSQKIGTSIVSDQFDKSSIGDKVVNKDLISYMRSRNIQFVAKKLKPLTRLYAFFDGVNVSKYCTPKLLEISMISGVFSVGETVVGTVRNTGLGPNIEQTTPSITFRVAQSNHKDGPYNSATSTYPFNPYTSQILQGNYSSTSTILNVDTFSLANQTQGEFSGWVESNMILVGQRSGAQATITNVRLISDLSSTLTGCFFIPNPNVLENPRFEIGNKVLSFIDNDINDSNLANTTAEEGFSSTGILETVQDDIISIRNARIQNKKEFNNKLVSKTTGTQIVSGAGILANKSNKDVIVSWYDPIAQSFLVEDSTGIFLTRCDIFFKSKDDMDIPVTLQLRTIENGIPTQKILPFSEITLDSSEVSISSNSSVATSFIFKSPVYLEGGKEYAICVSSNSTKYSIYVSRIGENDLLSQSFISNQPYLGYLFKSQNTSTWEASQWEDLKFVLYRADFIKSGTVEFYNPELSEGNNQIPVLMPNSINLSSRNIRVGLGTTIADSGLAFGNTVLQLGTNATGNYVGSAGSATSTLNVINAGIGYTPSSGSYTFNNVNLTSITGYGANATADITISQGVAIAATIVTGGSGYQIGDVLGITTIGNSGTGGDAKFSIVSIGSTNQLILNNVQGDFVVVGTGKTLQYINSSGITTILNYSNGGDVQISNINAISDGLHILVDHKNHGMYSKDNYVTISNVESDVKPTKLSVAYNTNSSSNISVESTSNLSTFENVGVGTTNKGYILIGDEIISYTSTSPGVINGTIVRGSNPKNYPVGTPVYKYELGGVSLRRINKTHYLNDVSISNPITLDSYNIKIDMTSDGTDRSTDNGYPKLFLNQTKSTGGFNIRATQNIPYEIITPVVHNLTVQGTSLSAELRSISGTSISGNELSYVDNGFESIALNKSNYYNSPRIIASKVNESNKLSTLPGNKSLNMRLSLNTIDTKLSPMVDTQRISTILTSNRINSVITNYATDSKSNTIDNDPTAFQYISKEIILENSASAIKIVLNAHVNPYCDIRAFYAVSSSQNFNPIFTPFPGYNNLNTQKQIINFENSDGSSDNFISPTTSMGFSPSDIEYKEYVFTSGNLQSFRSYRIKIIMTSTNQVYVPRMKDLKVIALA